MPRSIDGLRARFTSLVHRRVLVEAVIAVALLVGSGVWATRFWNAWTAQGGQPVFYQYNFEPAVMVACGKGFVISEHWPQPLEDFLRLRRDTFDCRDLPNDLKLGQTGLFQRPLIYLELTVAWSWRLLGISWSRMGPLFGLLFGIVIALVYGICRLGMGRLVAVCCACGLAISTSHLINLPHLRDYAKAPFTLALVLILGLLVTRRVRRGTVLVLAAAYGVVLGIGYGFRSDFLANLPVFVIVLFAFLDDGFLRNLRLKAAATVLFVTAFVVASWPALSAVYKQGGCQWHVTLLGLQSPFDAYLRLAPAPYDFGTWYSDPYIYRTVSGYARRMQPSSGPLGYCTHEYDVQSGRYLQEIVRTFPADVIARAYGSVLQIAELPFVSWNGPLTGWATAMYDARRELLRPNIGWGFWLTGGALFLVSAASLRLGLFLLFFVAYFGGYPAIQFQERHHFHLEFMTWWALGFIVHQTLAALWSLRRERPSVVTLRRATVRGLVFTVSGIALVVSALSVARWYQTRQARQLFNRYIAAPKVPFELPGDGLPPVDRGHQPQFLEVALNEAACGARPSVTFRYNPTAADGDETRTMTVTRHSQQTGLTRIYLPVFEHFRGLEFSDASPGCVVGTSRFIDLEPFPLLLGAVLPPEWETLPLHQRIADWEGDPLPPIS